MKKNILIGGLVIIIIVILALVIKTNNSPVLEDQPSQLEIVTQKDRKDAYQKFVQDTNCATYMHCIANNDFTRLWYIESESVGTGEQYSIKTISFGNSFNKINNKTIYTENFTSHISSMNLVGIDDNRVVFSINYDGFGGECTSPWFDYGELNSFPVTATTIQPKTKHTLSTEKRAEVIKDLSPECQKAISQGEGSL